MSVFNCTNCGSPQDEKARKCLECGTDFASVQTLIVSDELPKISQYLIWGILFGIAELLSLIAINLSAFIFSQNTQFWFIWIAPVPYSIYIFLSFRDLKLLDNKTHGYFRNTTNPVIMAIIFLLIPILAVGVKHSQLSTHLKNDHENEPLIPLNAGVVAIFGYVIPFVYNLLFTFVLGISFGIILSLFGSGFILYSENKWQKSLNVHITNHLKYLEG